LGAISIIFIPFKINYTGKCHFPQGNLIFTSVKLPHVTKANVRGKPDKFSHDHSSSGVDDAFEGEGHVAVL